MTARQYDYSNLSVDKPLYKDFTNWLKKYSTLSGPDVIELFMIRFMADVAKNPHYVKRLKDTETAEQEIRSLVNSLLRSKGPE